MNGTMTREHVPWTREEVRSWIGGLLVLSWLAIEAYVVALLLRHDLWLPASALLTRTLVLLGWNAAILRRNRQEARS